MHPKHSYKSYMLIALFVFLSSAFFNGCATSSSNTQRKFEMYNTAVASKYSINEYMYVTEAYKKFYKGETVKIKGVYKYRAFTPKGFIPLSKLSKKPIAEPIKEIENEQYTLSVNAPQGSKIRILNIKPVYKDNILLSKGNYHIEVTKSGYEPFKRWVHLSKNLIFKVSDLKQVPKVQSFKIEDGTYECVDGSDNIILTFKTTNSITTWDMAKKSEPTLLLSTKLQKNDKGIIFLHVAKSAATYTLDIKVVNNETKKQAKKSIGTFIKEKDKYIFDSQGKKGKCIRT